MFQCFPVVFFSCCALIFLFSDTSQSNSIFFFKPEIVVEKGFPEKEISCLI